jgi:hypothetical protein
MVVPIKAMQDAIVLTTVASVISFSTNKLHATKILPYIAFYFAAIMYVQTFLPNYSWEILHSSIVYFSFILHNSVKIEL